MHWRAFILSISLPLMSTAYDYTTQKNAIRFEVPSALVGPAELTARNISVTEKDKRIFVTALVRKGLLKNSIVGNLNISLLQWPEDVNGVAELTRKLEAHLTGLNSSVSHSGMDFQGGSWIIFEQRKTKSDKIEAVSCYAVLPQNELLYVGLVLDDKISATKRSDFIDSLKKLLCSFRSEPHRD
jgi:hypothetical protein